MILLLVLIAVLVVSRESLDVFSSPDTRAQRFVEQCASLSLLEVISVVSQQGGYYQVSDPMTSVSALMYIPLYRDGDTLRAPQHEEVIEQVIIGFRESIAHCFSELTELGYILDTVGETDISLDLLRGRVTAQVAPSALLMFDDRDVRLTPFISTVYFPLYELHEAALEVFSTVSESAYIPASAISRIAIDTGMQISYADISDSVVVFSLRPYGAHARQLFNFGVRYHA